MSRPGGVSMVFGVCVPRVPSECHSTIALQAYMLYTREPRSTRSNLDRGRWIPPRSAFVDFRESPRWLDFEKVRLY